MSGGILWGCESPGQRPSHYPHPDENFLLFSADTLIKLLDEPPPPYAPRKTFMQRYWNVLSRIAAPLHHPRVFHWHGYDDAKRSYALKKYHAEIMTNTVKERKSHRICDSFLFVHAIKNTTELGQLYDAAVQNDWAQTSSRVAHSSIFSTAAWRCHVCKQDW